ncbi:peptidoglycan recognition protein family protein [Clostridium sp. FP2]|uniref:peptidoglycan recognition protein family protein n=1 Tax=Clostridium sp. FP2 TaxID=2724481 RepID=UPI0013E9906B|nr:peptidoglycan recognition family protein [Clostridium sp. FP2]MBZ9622831.1 peptidoglycan recognition protein family protein [Clostridium sp. FP2]
MNVIETNLRRNGDLNYNNIPKMIVLHHAEAKNCTIQDINTWHLNNGWTMCGYHYFVNKKGNIYRGRPEKAQGSHCTGVNRCSISICAEGDFMTETMNEIQKQTIVGLCKDICGRHGVNDIKGHKEVPYSTDCPGTNYPLTEIKRLVNSSTSPSVPNKSSERYCKAWQIFYNKETGTGTRLDEDGFYGILTQNSLDFLLSYINKGKKYKYCKSFQIWFNKITDTRLPIDEDGYWGTNTEAAYQKINKLCKG